MILPESTDNNNPGEPTGRVCTEDEPPTETLIVETPTEGVPADEAPAAEAPTEEVKVAEIPAVEPPADEAPAAEAPTEEVKVAEIPAVEPPADEAPTAEAPAEEVKVAEIPAVEPPADEAPAAEAPAEEVKVAAALAVEPAIAEPPAAREMDVPAAQAPPVPGQPTISVAITAIQTLNIGTRDIVGTYLDEPTVDDDTERYCLIVRGWCVPRSTPLERVQLYLGDECLADVAPFHRPDVQYAIRGEPFALNSGFFLSVSALCLPASGALSVWAKLASGKRVQIGRIDIEARIPALNKPDYLKPLILFSVGRSGSTALMKLLTSHPAIAGHTAYPLETRFAQHSYHAMRIASSLATSYAEDMMTAFTARRPALGPNPSFGYFRDLDGFFHKTYAGGMIDRHMEMIDAFYRAQKPTTAGKGPVYFVEKSTQDPYILSVLDKTDGAKRIMLMRDPRDIMVSIRQFNEQTGYQSFGAERVNGFAEHAELIRSSIEWHLDAAGWNDERCLILKYEEMISNWRAAAARLFGFLGITDDEQTVESAAQAVDPAKRGEVRHATSASGSDSIGRWINDLSPEEVDICSHIFGDLLWKMGYA